jgi:phosphonopyruvate decarboxylase
MIYVEKLIKILKKNKVDFFTGVPDSVLKSLSMYLENNKNHLVAVNEGSAVANGIGYYLSTKKIPCVYMQNSGLGNAINPLTSIAHSKIYSIPMILIIGWRGSPGMHDEPQHMVKGKITRNLLEIMDIEYCVLNTDQDLKKINNLINKARTKSKPIALLVKNKTLIAKFKKKIIPKINSKLPYRKDIIFRILEIIKKNTFIVSSTGFTSRELHQVRLTNNFISGKDFYMVGGMGHAGSVSLATSMFKKKQVICLDGDGSILMHLGSLATIGINAKKNFKHILFNNNSHESVGNQKTDAFKINFKMLSKAVGYKNYFLINNKKSINEKLKKFLNSPGSSFLEIKINVGTLNKLGRPSNFQLIKKKFIN